MDKYEERRVALKALRAKMGRGAIRKIAEGIGKDPSYVSRMLYPPTKNGYKRIGEDSVEDLNRAFPDWLTTADEKELASQRRKETLDAFTIIQYDAGGRMGDGGLELRDQPGVIRSWTVNAQWLEENVRSHSGKTNLCIVTGFGDSMRPMFNPGDPLIVDTGVKAVEFDAVYFFRVGNEGFIKRLQRVPGQGLLAISENSAYRDWIIDDEMDFEVFGRVLKVWCSAEF